MKKRIRIQGLLIFLVIVLFVLFANFVIPQWQKEWEDELFDTFGVLFVLFGFLLRMVARGYKEEVSQGGRKLVMQGPYTLMRNPMYFGTLMIGTGIISTLFRFWTLPLFLVIYFSIYIPQVNREEKILSARFGKDYKSYCDAIPRYLPKIRRLSDFKALMSLPKLPWLKKESGPLTATILVIFIIEIWQDAKLFGFGEVSAELLELLFVILAFMLIVIVLSCREHSR